MLRRVIAFCSLLLETAANLLHREVKDPQFLPEKVSGKMAKELFERFQEHERIYQKLFAGLLLVLFLDFFYRVYVYQPDLVTAIQCFNSMGWVATWDFAD